jgi:4-amino-4-deoxy-L-arabinose transferase-like glycosyltransferase
MRDQTRRALQIRWLLVALLLVAFGLRVYRLDGQSFWSDEGLSLYRARLTLGENLSNIIVVPPDVPTRDTNPPLYFVALSLARAAAGDSEYVLRFLSVMLGVVTVPLLYVTGRRLFSPATGVLAAVLGTFAPLLIWYSQEARMYTALVVLSLASVYTLLRAIELSATHAVRRWLAWMLVTTAALYTHFTAFFLLPFEGLLILTALWRHHRRWVLIAAGGLIVLGLPIGLYGWSRAQTGVERSFGFRPLYSIVEEMSSALAVGRANETFQPLWAVLPSLLLLGIGSVVGLIKQRRSLIITGLYLLVPLLGFYAVTFVRPLFSGARHLLLIAPPFYLLVAYGLAVLWQRARLFGLAFLAVVLIFMGWWLKVQFTDPAYLKDDMRSAACTIAASATPEDVVIVHDAISSYVFDYYYRRCGGVAPWKIIPTYPSLDVDAALQEFQTTAGQAVRVWFLTHPRPLGGFDREALDIWARGHLLRLDHQAFPAIWLGSAYQLYTAHFPISDTLPASAEARDLLWPSEGLRLSGIDSVVISAERDHARIDLYWRLDQPAQRNFDFTLRLIDQSGAEWGLLRGPAFDNWSAKKWPSGQYIRQSANMILPNGLPAGGYTMVVSARDRQTNEPIRLKDGSVESEIASLKVSQ